MLDDRRAVDAHTFEREIAESQPEAVALEDAPPQRVDVGGGELHHAAAACAHQVVMRVLVSQLVVDHRAPQTCLRDPSVTREQTLRDLELILTSFADPE